MISNVPAFCAGLSAPGLYAHGRAEKGRQVLHGEESFENQRALIRLPDEGT